MKRCMRQRHQQHGVVILEAHGEQRRHQQHGIAMLEASVEQRLGSPHDSKTSRPQTHLTKLSHQSPLRLVPCQSLSVIHAGAAICYQASYGGGLVSGDDLDVNVHVKRQATLGLLTQGHTRVYPMRRSNNEQQHQNAVATKLPLSMTRMRSTYELEADALLVVAPDPLVTMVGSRLEQVTSVHINDFSASCVVIDWISARASANASDATTTTISDSLLQTQLRCYDASQQSLLVDALVMQSHSMPLHLGLFDSLASSVSMLVTGPRTRMVVEQCRRLQTQLMQPHARVRVGNHRQQHDETPQQQQHDGNHHGGRLPSAVSNDLIMESLAGRVILGMTRIPTNAFHDDSSHGSNNNDDTINDDHHAIYLMKWAAQSNQDLYRCLHYSLRPLANDFGMEFYKDRIRATKSATMPVTKVATSSSIYTNENGRKASLDSITSASNTTLKSELNSASTAPRSWIAYILADSALPVGSFAHSAGLEAASQLGLLQDGDGGDALEHNLFTFIKSSTQSMVQGAVPFVVQSHRLARNVVANSDSNRDFASAWRSMDRNAHVFLAGNGPACRASLDQGRSLLRVVSQLITSSNGNETSGGGTNDHIVLQQLQCEIDASDTVGHLSTVFGTATALLQVPEQEACELVGFCVARDMVSAAVRLNLLGPLASVKVLSQAQAAAQLGVKVGQSLADDADWAGSASSPTLEAVQPCHDVLAMRLFRT
ncbi:hypothetical protein MPSEU_000590800 [Mayamaea pseudoterrestris]|nr:hypothetical protein MPSEU_000590800 [Mayamaea pseudoterrestris]